MQMYPRARVGSQPPFSCQEKQALRFQSLFEAGKDSGRSCLDKLQHLADQSEINKVSES